MITFKQFLIEGTGDTLVYAFGRYSPPTRGHINHFMAVRDIAVKNGARYEIFVSKTVDNKKNPVPVQDKIDYIHKALPNMLPPSPATNMFSIIEQYAGSRIKNLIYVAGGDYFDEQSPERQLFDRLKSFAAEKGINLSVQSSGDRVQGISGTALRQAVINNDYATFLEVSPVGIGKLTEADARKMFEITKQGLVKAPKKPVVKK